MSSSSSSFSLVGRLPVDWSSVWDVAIHPFCHEHVPWAVSIKSTFKAVHSGSCHDFDR